MKLSYLEPRRGNKMSMCTTEAIGRGSGLLSASSPSHSRQSMARKILQK